MPRLIIDRFAGLRISRQERYQLRREDAKKCIQCSAADPVGKTCLACKEKNRVRMQLDRLENKERVERQAFLRLI